MRRRRRHSTQIFRSDTNSPPHRLQAAKPKKKGLRYILYFFLFATLCLGAYYVYDYYYPQSTQLNNSAAMNKTSDLPAAAAPLQVKEDELTKPAVEKRIQVEILNGCGKEGVAKIFQSYLQQEGFDVINTDNYIENGKRRWDVPASMVIARTGNIEAAGEVARSLGISNQKVVSKSDPNAVYDISVVLGRDYVMLKAVTSNNR